MNIEKARFLEDTKNHTMNVRLDTGNNRHLIFTNGGSSVYRYEIITWNEYLCYCGDMGTFVFSRITDMFQFFRDDDGKINPGYWAQKLEAEDKNDGYEKYSVDLFNDAINYHINNYWEFENDEQKEEVMMQVGEDVLDSDNEQEAYDAAMSYKSDYGHEFDDWDGGSFKEPTHRYIWCCLAIVKGINQYDKWKSV